MLSRSSLRFKINLCVGLTLLVIAAIFGTVLAVYETHRRSDAIQQIAMSLDDLTAQYREQLGNEIFAAQRLAVEATLSEVTRRKNILSITAFDDQGQALAATDPSDRSPLVHYPGRSLPAAPQTFRRQWNGQAVLTYTSPISAYGERVGYWRIRYTLSTLERQTTEIVAIFAALMLSLSILIGLLLNSILVRFVLNPVYLLRNAMQHIQGPDGQSEPDSGRAVAPQSLDRMVQAFDDLAGDRVLSPATNDEIGSLAHAFRRMLFALKNAYIGIRTDALTGLSNRVKLDEALESEMRRAQRYRNAFSIIILDIDHFKRVNDTYGHLAGDEVLKAVAGLLTDNLRETDTAGRWGGEEFLILLPHQDRAGARRLADKLRIAIESADFPGVGTITASLGVTAHAAGDTLQGLVERADAALYTAKRSGRNRVEEK